jgi:hypothetical protein
VFRKGLEEEFAEYDRREQELKELRAELLVSPPLEFGSGSVMGERG